MIVIDNRDPNVLNFEYLGDDRGFLPAGSFTFTNATKVLAFTASAATVPSGHTFARMNIEVFDRAGGKKVGHIDTATGTVSIDLDADDASGKPLDLTREINIKVWVTTNLGLSKDGWFYGLLPVADAAGNLGF